MARDRRRPRVMTARAASATLAMALIVGSVTWAARSLIVDASQPTDLSTTTSTLALPSTAPSVLWILLDEASLWSLIGTNGTINEQRWPGFAELARLSTWYRDTMTTAQWTYFAVPSMLTSTLPSFKGKPILENHPRNFFTALADRMPLDVRQTVTNMCPATVCPPEWRLPYKSAPTYLSMLSEVVDNAANASEPSAHFVHVQLPHRPWVLSTETRLAAFSGKDTRNDGLLDRRRDIYQSHLRQYVAVDGEISAALKKLRAAPNWDQTMVIVTADHGITFAPGESVRDRINPGNPGSMEDVFRVPLFIKYPGQTVGAVSDCVTSTLDILPTVLSQLGVDTGWKYDGFDLSKGCPDRTTRRVRWPGGKADMNSRFDAVLDRVRYYNDWVSADGGVDEIFRVGLSGSLIGAKVPVVASDSPSVSWTLNDAAGYQTIGTGRLAPVPVRATGRIRTSRQVGSNVEGLIAINGTFVGVIPEIAGAGPNVSVGHYFNTNLLTRVLVPGPQVIELWLALWDRGGVTLSRVGPPGP